MGESLCICCDCGSATSNYRSEWCENCQQHVCNGCSLEAHNKNLCEDLENQYQCHHCEETFKNYNWDQDTGKGDMEGFMCQVCEEPICEACEETHMVSEEHTAHVREEEEHKVESEKQAMLKRKRQEEPDFIAKRAKLEADVQSAAAALKASEAILNQAKRDLETHNA